MARARHARRYGALLTTAGLVAALVPAAAPVAAATPGSAPRAAAPQVTVPQAAAARPSVTARSAAVYDRKAHKWRYRKQAATRRPIASVTKVMTAYVVLKNARWKKKVTIGKAAVAYARRHGASTAGLRAGERISLGQALYAIMLPSGAEAAYQLAKNYGPGKGRFVAKMNAAARRLKMTRTHYTNPDGLPYKDSKGRSAYSTATDQLKLVNAVLRSKTFRKVVGTTKYRLRAGNGHRAHTWVNTNRLLDAYRGANGVKTGTTNAAGSCLAFSAYRNKRNMIGIVLHSSSTKKRFADATRLLDYAYGMRTTKIRLRDLPAGTDPD